MTRHQNPSHPPHPCRRLTNPPRQASNEPMEEEHGSPHPGASLIACLFVCGILHFKYSSDFCHRNKAEAMLPSGERSASVATYINWGKRRASWQMSNTGICRDETLPPTRRRKVDGTCQSRSKKQCHILIEALGRKRWRLKDKICKRNKHRQEVNQDQWQPSLSASQTV